MTSCKRLHWATLAAVFWLANLPGCQQMPALQNRGGLLSSLDDSTTKSLTPQQLADVQVGLGRVMEKRGQLAEAMAAYQEAVKQNPKNGDAYLRLARLYDQQGQFAIGEDCYKRALALTPGNADIYSNMGYSLYLQHHWAEAEMNLRQAIALEPGHRRAHNNLALVLTQFGRRDEALAEFSKGGCTSAEAHANVAFLLMLERALPEASAEYEQALAVDPSLTVAKKGAHEVNILQARFSPDNWPPAGKVDGDN
jgi:Flp pilus assembly protein TadD